MTKRPVPLPTQALLKAVRSVTENLSTLSKDPRVRAEAMNVGQAVSRLLDAIRDSRTGRVTVEEPGSQAPPRPKS